MQTILTHHHLAAEEVNDKHGPAILLTQQGDIDEPHSILIHPWQLRAVCQEFGIIASDGRASTAIETLQRRMLGLLTRIEGLAALMASRTNQPQIDLIKEVLMLGALQDVAREWCAEFADSERTEPRCEKFSERGTK